MADDDNSGVSGDMKLLAQLVALFGVKKGTDWFVIWSIIKLAILIGFLVWCFCD